MVVRVGKQQTPIQLDEADYVKCKHYHLWADFGHNGLAYVRARLGTGPKLYLHRLIMCAGPKEEVDHINNDGLDNRRENLRICSRSMNMLNGSRKARGVHFVKRTGKWTASLMVDYKHYHLGHFVRFEDALAARKAAYAAWAQDGTLPEKRKVPQGRGVSYRKDTGKWHAYLGHGKTHTTIGYFLSEESALWAVKAARETHA